VSFDHRTCRLYVFIGDTCTRELFGHKPDLQLIPPQNVADQQIVGSIVAARRCGMGRFAGFIDDELVSLQQAE
jgi:tRNA isopentenyl-2-thiomethyl-A-37 hydroxylase MiaE